MLLLVCSYSYTENVPKKIRKSEMCELRKRQTIERVVHWNRILVKVSASGILCKTSKHLITCLRVPFILWLILSYRSNNCRQKSLSFALGRHAWSLKSRKKNTFCILLMSWMSVLSGSWENCCLTSTWKVLK